MNCMIKPLAPRKMSRNHSSPFAGKRKVMLGIAARQTTEIMVHRVPKYVTLIRGCARLPIIRMVVYAVMAPQTPMREMPTAIKRCEGVAVRVVSVLVGREAVVFVDGEAEAIAAGTASDEPLAAGGMNFADEEKREVGCAMKTTPKRDTKPAIFSRRVKGSSAMTEHSQQAPMGARKVITVASAKGR